jgi:hypothetical protein
MCTHGKTRIWQQAGSQQAAMMHAGSLSNRIDRFSEIYLIPIQLLNSIPIQSIDQIYPDTIKIS